MITAVSSHQAIFFDLDGTLVDEQLALQALERRVGALLTAASGVESDFTRALLQTEQRNIPILGYGLASYAWSFAETAYATGIPSSTMERVAAEFGTFLRDFYDGTVHVVPGARETLVTLRELGYGIHVVTRGIDFEQRHKIYASGLLELIDSVTVVQSAKDRAIHRIAVDRSLSLANCCMIGDSLVSDILPALQLGLKAVLVDAPTAWGHDQHATPVPEDDPAFRRCSLITMVPSAIQALLPQQP